MIKISENTKAIQQSRIRKMFNKALEYDNVLSFSVGEPDFTASQNVVEAGCRAIHEGKTKYTANAGVIELRQTIAAYIKRVSGLEYDPKREIICTLGAVNAIYLAMKVLLNPGDEVILNEPCWTNYIQQIMMCGGVPVSVPTDPEKGFDLDVDAIRAAVTDKTRIIVLNSPCNPTGAVVGLEAMQQLAQLAQERDLLIFADEVYKHILYDGATYTSFATLPGMKERTLMVDSLSKSYAMTGWRIAYAAGPEEIISNMTKLQENVCACPVMPSQMAAIEAFNGPQDHLEHMVREYEKRRDFVVERINSIPKLSCSTPKGAFYAFVNMKETGMECEEFAMRLLEEKRVVVVPGTAFGDFGQGYFRLSYATSMDQLVQGMDRLEAFMKEFF